MNSEKINFDELCNKLNSGLNISALENVEPDEAELRKWCQENLSSDLTYENYYNLKQCAKNYLNVFLPNTAAENKSAGPCPALNNMTPVQYAAYQGYEKWLSQPPHPDEACLNTPAAGGMTPLHLAAARGYHQTVLTLLKLGADPDIVNEQNQLPIHSVLIKSQIEKGMDAQREAIFYKFLAICKNPDMPDKWSTNIVHLMLDNGFDTSLLKHILVNFPLLAKQQNKDGHYPIHRAIVNQDKTAVNYLLTIEDVDKQLDKDDQNILHYAAIYCSNNHEPSKGIFEACFKATYNHQQTNRDGQTPLMLAKQMNNKFAMRYMNEHEESFSNRK